MSKKFNGTNEPKVQTDDQVLKVLASQIMGRANLAAAMGKTFGGDRDVYTALGYTKTPQFRDYYNRYTRQDVATRLIDAFVDATWMEDPTVIEDEDENETAFEAAWNTLVKDKKIYHFLSRGDRVTGIGEFGVILLGFNDNQELNMEVTSATELIYMRPYMQSSITIDKYEKDTSNERFGQPLMYKLETSDGDEGSKTIYVHWSRILHLAEGTLENDIIGRPRLRPVLNRLQDLEIVSGGSAEMFWRGAFPGLSFNADADANLAQTKVEMEDEIAKYIHGLERYMKLQGITIQELKTQVSDPSSHVEVLIGLIAATYGMPQRILTGSERGELASSMDDVNWKARIDERRKNYVSPMILEPFIERLISLGVLPEVEEYFIEWPDLFALSIEDKATVSKTMAETLAVYSNAPSAQLIVPTRMFLKKFMNFDDDEIDEMESQAQEEYEMEAADLEQERLMLEEERAAIESQNPNQDEE